MPTAAIENVAAPAGHGRRTAAALLDAVVYAVVVAAFGYAGSVVGFFGANGSASDWREALDWVAYGALVGFLAGIAAWSALTVWLMRRPGAHNGQTLGKQTLGIRVEHPGGGAIGGLRALAREVLARGVLVWLTAAALGGFLVVGMLGFAVACAAWYAPALFDDERRALHDRVAGTRVVASSAVAANAPATDVHLWPAPTIP